MLTRQSRRIGRLSTIATALIAMTMLGGLSGCMKRKLKPLNPCLVSGVVAEVAVTGVDKVDLLFVVDSSKSMIDEQEKLRVQIPRLVQTLASGMRPDGSTFPAAKDMHLGVVTTDMGVPGLAAPLPESFNCSSYGDDGILRTGPGAPFDDGATAWAPSCTGVPGNPTFISFTEGGALDATTAADQLGCLAQVGPGGCGFEAQLEAPLKALWPALDIDSQTGQPWVDPATGQQGNRVTFLSDQPGQVTYGHGDGANNGFLRNDTSAGISLIAVILVTDEEDCSPRETDFLNYPALPGTPYEGVPPNLLCVNFPDKLWPTDRYVEGLQKLRPGNENLVIFAAIAGVPQYLVTPDKLEQVDFTDDGSRAGFYTSIRQDQNMMPTLRADGQNINFSCQPTGAAANEGAYPPLRILDVVEKFGENGVIQSICQDDYGPAIDSIIEVIARQLGAVCLPRQLVRDSEGKVGCNVVWELPKVAPAPETPTSCDQKAYLTAPEDASKAFTNDGRARCVVDQLAVMAKTKPGGEGWYYDDFSAEVQQECRGADKQRIAFGDTSTPPNGVNVKLECLNEVQSVPQTRTDIAYQFYNGQNGNPSTPPSIGTQCANDTGGADDSLCAVRLTSGGEDTSSLFCHPQLNVCVQPCTSDADCPKAWVCDDRAETLDPTVGAGQPICVNPTCGTN